jgi:hypothetical protein
MTKLKRLFQASTDKSLTVVTFAFQKRALKRVDLAAVAAAEAVVASAAAVVAAVAAAETAGNPSQIL